MTYNFFCFSFYQNGLLNKSLIYIVNFYMLNVPVLRRKQTGHEDTHP